MSLSALAIKLVRERAECKQCLLSNAEGGLCWLCIAKIDEALEQARREGAEFSAGICDWFKNQYKAEPLIQSGASGCGYYIRKALDAKAGDV